MYVDHFKLSARTFTDGPETGYFQPNHEVDAALTRLREVMLARDSMAIVTGGPGVGKSALISAAQASIEDKTVVAAVDLRQTDADSLIDLLLLKLGASLPESNNEAASLHQLRTKVAEHNQSGRRVTAVVDLTGLTVERAKRILQLIHMAGEPGGQLNIILLGPHALHKLLNAPGLIHLRQRVCFRYRVRPLMVDEVDNYLRHQFDRAGGSADSILEPGTGETVFRYVGGVPRLINTLMDAVLSEAANLYAERIGSDLLNIVARQLGWKPLSGNQSAALKASPAPAATAKPPVLSLDQEAASLSPEASPNPMSENTAMMLLDTPINADKPAAASAASVPELTPEPARNFPKATDKFGDTGVIPEMSADDTSATGMLRLEDLDSRFAETIFGEDANAAASDAVAAKPMIPDEAESEPVEQAG